MMQTCFSWFQLYKKKKKNTPFTSDCPLSPSSTLPAFRAGILFHYFSFLLYLLVWGPYLVVFRGFFNFALRSYSWGVISIAWIILFILLGLYCLHCIICIEPGAPTYKAHIPIL